jgi:quinoprotein glucose dehydrogenase
MFISFLRKRNAILLLLLSGVIAGISLGGCHSKQSNHYDVWQEYLGGPDRDHYSSLTQINPGNVKNLKVAWTYEMKDSGQMQMNPVIVDGVLYGVNTAVQAFAVDAATGKQLWIYGDSLKAWHSTSRGVAYWSDGKDKRILYTIGPDLIALDASTGKLVPGFGKNGKVDLHTGLPDEDKDKFIVSNTPGTVFENLIIVPVRVSEDEDAAAGDIRAFDVRTGKLVWSFHTIPHEGELGYDTWPKDAYKSNEIGAVNNWAGSAIDVSTGILYVPVGSAAPDFYGGHRQGTDFFADCLVALDARSGKYIWHYQFVHHDLWDRDPPATPNLITVHKDGKVIPAVAQITKQGFVFVFDRKTGQPLFPVKEVAVPASTLTGEVAWSTQPVPALPKPFARQSYELTENDINPLAENKDELINQFRQLDKRLFAAPSLSGALLLPGYDGGAEWGGAAADPADGVLYVNANEMAWILKMDTALATTTSMTPGEAVYTTYCTVCHKSDKTGSVQSGYPSLVNIEQRRDMNYVHNLLGSGKGMMPGFPQLPEQSKKAVIAYLFGQEKKEASAMVTTVHQPVLPYKHAGYTKFLDSKGLPGIAPPWGSLTAIDLNTGAFKWQIPLGNIDSAKEPGGKPTGCENYGGPVVTASGLLFIAATKDGLFRAFNKNTGQLLWSTKLPAAAFATPATYEVKGRQYIVVACGGEKLGTAKGNKLVAFAVE